MNEEIRTSLRAASDVILKDYLANDAAFGILTRPALEMAMHSSEGVAFISVVDFQDIHKMNIQFGYSHVNSIIREAIFRFTQQYPNVVVGRIFSGDEIAILDDNPENNLQAEKFASFCKRSGLGFRWIDSTIPLGKHLGFYRSKLTLLSEQLRSSKYAKMLSTTLPQR